MNESHYTSLPVAQELAEAGIKLRYHAVFVRRECPETNWFGEWKLIYQKDIMEWLWDYDLHNPNYEGGLVHQEIPTYSLSELLDRLPAGYVIVQEKYDKECTNPPVKFKCFYHGKWGHEISNIITIANTAPDATAKMVFKLERGK
jgi:hypothetical protein